MSRPDASPPWLRVALAMSCLAMTILCGCSGPEARHTRYVERGDRYLAEGKLDKALVEYRNALQLQPGDVDTRVRLGHVAEKGGGIREAFADYRAAVDLDPQNPHARASLARIYVFADEPMSALELVEPALIGHPDDPDLLTVRGAAREELKDTSEAFADARRAVQVDPKNENAVALLASLYQKTNEGAKAVEVLRAALTTMPSSIDLRQILANVYGSVDEPELAEAQLQEIVKVAPQEFSYRLTLAQFYERAKRYDDVGRVLKQAVAALSDNNRAKLAYVEFVGARRSTAEGQRILHDFIARDPHNYDLQLGSGEMQQKGGDLKSALATYQSIVAAAGERPQALIARDRIAAILVGQGHPAEALVVVNEVLRRSPRDTDALIMRGNLELASGKPAAAIADLRAVLRDQPDDVPILRTLARAHLASGEPALAEESLRDAVKAAPRDIGVRIDLAQLLLQSNRFPSALAILEETVIEAPTNLDARVALARAYIGAKEMDMAAHATDDLKVVAPNRAVGWYLGGLVAQSLNHPDDAQSQFEHALGLEPKSLELVASLVRLDVARDRLPDAFAQAKAAVAAQPRASDAYNILGELYLATKDYSKAIETFVPATQLAPQAWLPRRNLALAQIETGDLKAATQTYEAAIAAAGLNPGLVIDLAALYERQGRIDDAIKQYEALHEHSPRLEIAANNLAMLLVTYRKDALSLEQAEQLTASFDRSQDPSMLDTQGWVRFKRGDLVEALPELETAAARLPASKVVRYHLGMAQLEAKQFAKARSNLEAAVAGGQSFAGSEEARAALAKLRS